MSKESSKGQPSIVERIQQAAGVRYTFLDKVKIEAEEGPAHNILALVVKSNRSNHSRAPWPYSMGGIETSIVEELSNKKGIVPEVDPSVGRRTHEDNNTVFFGRFPFQEGGELYEIVFFPTEEFGKDRIENIKALLKIRPQNFTEVELSNVLSIPKQQWKGLFGEE